MTEVGTKNYQNQAIRITDLAVTSPVLDGYAFSNCSIFGPAILVPQEEVSIVHCSWDAPGLDALYWVIEPGRTFVIGAIGVMNTSFVGCSFQGVGLAGTEEAKEAMAGGFNDAAGD